MSKSLWGDLSDLKTVPTPKSLLDQQATILTETTNGVLVGRVSAMPTPAGSFNYRLDVVVPTMNQYAYTLLTINHGIELYPVNVVSPKPPNRFKCDTDQEFEGALGSILSSADVKQILSRLLSQAK